MFELKRQRGRPKGTGIDDSDRLACLAEMLRNHPEMRPTTGIRAMGIADPSVVRRIRDKFKIYQRSQTQLEELGLEAQPQHARTAVAPGMVPAPRI